MKFPLFIFALSLLALTACEKDKSNPTSSTPSFVATIDGEVIQFQNPKVFIKSENGIPFSEEIICYVISGDTVKKALNFRYAGDLASANWDSTFTVIMGAYYEDDYSESWRNVTGPGGIDFTLTGHTSTKASGYFTDFMAADNNGDTLSISDISFENIPIRYADF